MFYHLHNFVKLQSHNSTGSSAKHLRDFVLVVVKYPEGGDKQ